MAGTGPAMAMEALSPNFRTRHRFRGNFQTGSEAAVAGGAAPASPARPWRGGGESGTLGA